MCTRLRIELQDERRGWRSPPSMSKPLLTNHMTICSVAKNSSCRAVPGSALCAGPIQLAYSPIQSKLFVARCFHPSGYRRQGYGQGAGSKAGGGGEREACHPSHRSAALVFCLLLACTISFLFLPRVFPSGAVLYTLLRYSTECVPGLPECISPGVPDSAYQERSQAYIYTHVCMRPSI